MKKISILLTLVMLLAVMTGCTPKDNGQNPENEKPDNGGSIIPDDDNSNPEDVDPDQGNGDNEVQTPGGSWSDESGTDPDTDPENKPVDQPQQGGDGSGEGTVGGVTDEDEITEGDNTVTAEIGTKVGDLMATVEITTLAGEKISVEDFRGKIVVFNFWATWCPPCKAELPDFNKVAAQYKDEVVIIAAHISSGSSAAESYVNTNFPETDIIFAYDTAYDEAYTAAGGIGYVPQTAVLDKNGVIVYTDSGMLSEAQLISIIESAK